MREICPKMPFGLAGNHDKITRAYTKNVNIASALQMMNTSAAWRTCAEWLDEEHAWGYLFHGALHSVN